MAKAFNGVTLPDLWTDIVLLAAVFALRGALAWGFETTGRRAASAVLSELRLALVERRLRAQPAALDGVEGRRDRGGLPFEASMRSEGYFARYLPQVVLACVVPVLVLALGRPPSTSSPP